ncbi:probable Na(+) H(+) antiporter nhx-9 isoform X3 [Paramuricea clavata]|nr:probable Na(+) H(+) antiporter nhx-9 isoform X3 [Paramuricea clavata]
MVILLGILLGSILNAADFQNVATISNFNSRIFFLFLLPPIVLDAGYFLHTRAFFDNIGTILLYAVVGTIFNTFTVGLTLYITTDLGINLLQMLLFSCLIAAVDPVAVLAVFEEVHVNEVLYILVFGESLLNDAVTVVLYRLFEALVTQGGTPKVEEVFIGVAAFFVVSLGGMLIGIFWAYLTAFLSKFIDHVKVLEPIFVVCMCYMSYLSAELFHFSGIISIVTCAIVMKPYVEANISQKSRIPLKYFMKMASSLSETIIFMMLGVILFDRQLEFDAWFTLLTIIFILVYRCLGVVLLTWLANSLRLNKLGKVDQFIMAYGGLRGAVSFSLATVLEEKYVPKKNIMETTTIAVVFFTVFVQGITIKPLVNLLKVKRAVKRKEVMLGEVNDKLLDHLLGGVQDVIQHRGRYYWKNLHQYVDMKYLRPWFMREMSDQQAIDETVLMVYRKISSREAVPPGCSRDVPESIEEPDEFEHVVKDRRRSSGLAPPQEENQKFKNVVQHVQLAMLLSKQCRGTSRRFSRNNILDETDTCDEALRMRRCAQTAQVPRNVISRKVSREQQISGDERDNNACSSTQFKVPHKPHHKRHKKHGHKHGHHHGKHQKLGKKLSDIPESPPSSSPPGIDSPSGRYSPPGPDTSAAQTNGTDGGDTTSGSDNETQDMLPKLADLEPSSPQLAKDFSALHEPTVSMQSGSAAADEGIDETVM